MQINTTCGVTNNVNTFKQTLKKEQATNGESFSRVYNLHSDAMGLHFIWVLTSNAGCPRANKVAAVAVCCCYKEVKL